MHCSYCGSEDNIHQDHLVAKTKGGVKTIPSCSKCNQSKGKKALMEWLRWLKINRKSHWRRIEKYQKGKRSDIAKKVQKIRDEK